MYSKGWNPVRTHLNVVKASDTQVRSLSLCYKFVEVFDGWVGVGEVGGEI